MGKNKLENIFKDAPYMNIHAHISDNMIVNPSHFTLLNLDYSEFDKYQANQFYSAGLHPWFIKEFQESWFEKLAEMQQLNNVLAIGECGLDRNINIDFGLQQHVFHKQILLANKLKKPLIIHSVRAFYDVVSELKKAKNKMPAIYHGYNNSLQIAETLMNNNGYLSFGKSILQSKNNTAEILKKLPLDKIFFESDESINTIESVFEKAADLFNLDIKTLKQKSINNFKKVFGI
jgi:TatD DNase family protein